METLTHSELLGMKPINGDVRSNPNVGNLQAALESGLPVWFR